MSTIAELTVPAREFALRETLEATDDLDVEIERVVAYDPDHVMPYVWFADDEAAFDGLEDALADDPTVEAAERLTDLDDERLYRMHWVDDVTVILHLLTEERATVMDASVEGRQWRFRVLVPERESLSRTYDFATEQGLTIEVRKIHRLEDDRRGRYGLTDAQYETLVAALEHGYYEIPRAVDMDALSDELDVSHQALSERLRRAHLTLVEEAIEVGSGDE
ncbi:helix-turn-helix domain-containing protein [Haloterrigena sp. SYSU A558-1]|uniref:Helix-turn-helix domain-containing protein n=1 Tax=Haloterrigena gelatinilytica TaxID=2741724 RepID=A0A8J8KGS4_9EURY|nr:helix-turn-helix domain-containing protein [Haloterrigena gelatinilytica]NUB92816.1 helix-turn-helix domain-containing protein [Haloterrigena gelatinilytica]NUC71270.1 helix-turn-helix domain-containing protein [Haloterrigena gelatinilytica]